MCYRTHLLCESKYVTLHFRDRRGAASLRYRNRAEITVLMCKHKPYPVWFSCRRKSYPVYCEHSLRLDSRKPSDWFASHPCLHSCVEIMTGRTILYADSTSPGTLRNHDGDGNENARKATGLMSKTTILHVHHAFLYISLQPRPQGFSLKKWEKPWGRGWFLCRPCTTRTWIDQISSLLGNGNGKAINCITSVWTRARSLLFSSNPVSLLLSNWAHWNNREKKVKGYEIYFSATFLWTSPLSDRKVLSIRT